MMKYRDDRTKKLLSRCGGAECTDPDLIHELVDSHVAPAIGRLVAGQGGNKRPRPLPAKEEWEKEQGKSNPWQMNRFGTATPRPAY